MHSLLAKCDENPTYPSGRVNGVRPAQIPDPEFDSDDEDDDDEFDNMNYEEEFVKKEMKLYETGYNKEGERGGYGDDLSTNVDCQQYSEMASEDRRASNEIYKKYNFLLNLDVRSELPIDSFRSRILTRIALNQVVVIQGDTGCGKTTQVPQMIMDSLRENNEVCNIIVTQPRKIATINVAKRVCEERGWTLGTVCGYQVGLEKKVSPDQLITYVTTGVLLQKLIHKKSLTEYSHIIIDEVHERNQELDFLLLIVRKFLFTNSPHVKLILMSATIDADQFAYYFRKKVDTETIPAPIINIDEVSQYGKTIFYWDQYSAFVKSGKFDKTRPEITSEVWNMFIFLVKIFDKLETPEEQEKPNGNVLVFLPGINEIEEAHRLLVAEQTKTHTDSAGGGRPKSKWEIVPLHSSLPNDEQAKVFIRAPPGHRKIILSTNIAESSVTVPNTTFVIDFCLTKVLTVDPITKYASLKLDWASHVNCDQRAGRVGRTCDGRVYRLVSNQFYNECMVPMGEPEILRAPLDRIVLQTKMLDLNETPAQILALALDPPNFKNIESTLWQLKEIGGLLKTCRGILSNADGDITFLGKVMALLPIDVHLSKLIVFGHLYSCLEETIIIAAGCSIQNIFSVPFQRRLEAYRKVLLWADESCSDLIALLNLYSVWENLHRENCFSIRKLEVDWCHRNLISIKGLREWKLLITEIKSRLERLRIRETGGQSRVHLSESEKPTVLKVIMAGAFYPNFFVKSSDGRQKGRERECVKTIGGRDPCTTIYFSGFETNQPGQIYVRQIKRMLREDGEQKTDCHISFDGSTKIYVEFRNISDSITFNTDGFNNSSSRASKKIPKQLYEMIRKRQLKYEFPLDILPYKAAWEFAEKNGCRGAGDPSLPLTRTNTASTSQTNCFTLTQYNPIPSNDCQYIQIHITNHIDAGHFWVQIADERTTELLEQIEEALNGQALQRVDEQLKLGKIYAAKFREDNCFYRCRLVAVAGAINQILFIDYGNIQEVKMEELYYLPQRPQCFVAPLAFECVMYGIKPSYKCNPTGTWNEEINEHFRNMSSGIVLYGEVYSVVNDTVELEIYRSSSKSLSLNQFMLNEGYAEPSVPSFLSRQNHDIRMTILGSDNPSEEAVRLSRGTSVSYADFPDPELRNTRRIYLKGPFSPFEYQLYSCTYLGQGKPVSVEGTSVNAVLLDTEPDNPHSRLLVAAYVGQTADGNRLKLRQTTLLPNVAGFPMLLAAIFCPTMEPKLTADKSLVASILCGLGYNRVTNKPLYPAHDIVLDLDTVLKIEELEKINRLRYLMNTGIKTMHAIEQERATQTELFKLQSQIKEAILSLIYMAREPIDSINVTAENVQWGVHGNVGLLKPTYEDEEQDIWPLLWFVHLPDITPQQKAIAKNLEDLDNMTMEVKPFEETCCELCQTLLPLLSHLRLHISSKDHKENEEHYKSEISKDVM
ncbi:unnamed protein product [Ceutorhynchus assimilis]|uniref:Probable ATP-dependent RNA helicase spindle-E n=1 Tax=Ceutorhynchus assimilis TaxID=467358 RepID=A0A9N9MRI5_9CUCU|nr:unnamed protein product [Ceutorhynchus assimilis]